MKEAWKRYRWDLILLCNIFIISLFILKVINKYENIYQIANQSSDTLNNTSIHFIINTEDKINFSFLKENDIPFTLLQKKSDSQPIHKIVYSNAYFKVSEGRSFTQNDFFGDKHIALCGSNTEEIIQIEPFMLYGQEYEMIGKISDQGTLESRYGVFYTDGKSEEYIGSSEYILEGFKQRDIEEIYEVIADKMEKANAFVKRTTLNSTKFKDIYSVSEKSIIIGILVILFACSSLLLISFFWLSQFDETHQVYYLFGLDNFVKKIYRKFFLLFLVGYFIAFLCQTTKYFLTAIVIFIFLGMVISAILSWGVIYKKKGEWDEKDSWGNII